MASFIITTTYGPISMHQFFLAVSDALAERGHRVINLVPRQRKDIEDYQSNPAIYTWPSPRPTRLHDARFLYHLAREYETDLILGNFSATNLSLLVGWLARIPARVTWHHTIERANQLDYPQPRWRSWFLNQRRRAVYRFATHFLTYTEASKRDLTKTFGVRSERIRPIFPVVPDPLAEVEPVPVRQHNKIACVSRLNVCKGQDILIRALPAVKAAHPEIEVEFIGNGPLRGELIALAEKLDVADICTFSGTLPRQRVLEQMAASALCVVPSRHEAFGFVNVEALGMGTPIVASDADGIPEVVLHGQTGLLARSENPGDFSEKILQLMADPEMRQQFGRNAREHFVNTFSEAHIERFVQWFEQAVGGKR